jgi:hypothetical protein
MTLAVQIVIVARAIPTVRMNEPVRSFCSANTCSKRERFVEFALLARRIALGIEPPFCFLQWIWLTKPLLAGRVSLAVDR